MTTILELFAVMESQDPFLWDSILVLKVSSQYRKLQVSVTSLLSWDFAYCKGMAW